MSEAPVQNQFSRADYLARSAELRRQEWAEQEIRRRQRPERPSMRAYRQLQILEQLDRS
jgi:hypothetical protein